MQVPIFLAFANIVATDNQLQVLSVEATAGG